MDWSWSNLVFTPAPWSELLRAFAAAAVLWEALALSIWCRKKSGRGGIALAAASLAAGPVVAAAAGIFGLMTFVHDCPLRGAAAIRAGLWGALIAAMGALTVLASGKGQCGSLAVLGVAAIFWTLRGYARTTSPIKPLLKALLLGLRIAAILLAVLWATGPNLTYTTEETTNGVLLLGLDTSASMQRRDVTLPGSGSGQLIRRFDAARSALQKNSPVFEQIARSADLQWFTFASDPARLNRFEADDLSAAGEPNGGATAIGDCSATALDWYAGKNIWAILILSDGCNNTSDRFAPDRFAELMGARGVPIYTASAGSATVTKATRDLSVKDLASPDEVEAFNRLPISVAVGAMGLPDRTVEVVCRFADKEIETRQITIRGDHDRQSLQFMHVPLAAGYHRLTVSARVLGKEVRDLGGQGQAGKLVHVTDRELRVLYVEGKFRYETKYIMQALAGGRRMTVDRRVLATAPGKRGAAALGENIDDWLAYHAIVLGDVDAGQFSPRQLAIMRELVDQYGKGLCMIGGSRSFGRGGWQNTVLADVMPVDLSRSENNIVEPVRVVPTADGAASDLMKIDPENKDSAAAWQSLPPLSGANRLGPPKTAAVVLARSEKGEPLIVAQQFGKGRSLAIAFDTTWNWVLTPPDTAELQRRFWRQAVIFLANPRGNVWIATDKTSYDLDRLLRNVEVIVGTAGVDDSKGRSLPDAPARITLIGPDGKSVPVAMSPRDNMRSGRIGPVTAAGAYRLKMEAVVEGKTLIAEHKFEVLHRDLEAMDVLANPALLESMSKTSGGRSAPVARLDDLLKDIKILLQPRKAPHPQQRNLSDELSWPILIAFIALLCLEWSIRKRRGLV